MALETNFGADAHLFVGEDKHVIIGGGAAPDGNEHHILEYPGDASSAVVNVSGFAMTCEVRTALDAASPVFTLTTSGGEITVGGVFNASQALNTQYVDIFISDTNSLLLVPPGTYYWALKRMDAGLETIIAFGTMVWSYAAVR